MSCTRLFVVLLTLMGLMVCSSSVQASVIIQNPSTSPPTTPTTLNVKVDTTSTTWGLTDWGISLDSQKHLSYDSTLYNKYTYTGGYSTSVSSGTVTTTINGINGCKIVYALEDSNDFSNNYTVGPLGGGQNYDAEALVVSVVGKDLYIAIATGQRPDNGTSCFAPGDICISDASDVWGIEVGGGKGVGMTSSGEIKGGDSGSTYKLTSNGYTDTSWNWSTSPTNNAQKAGSIWDTDHWLPGINGSNNNMTQLNPSASETCLAQLGKDTSNSVGSYVYNFDSSFSQHAFIEICVKNYATLFGDDLNGAKIQWAPACGNDVLDVHLCLPGTPGPGPVPEPASMMIWAVLLLSAFYFARKKLSPFSRP